MTRESQTLEKIVGAKFIHITSTNARVFALDDYGRIWELDIMGEWKALPPVPTGKEK